MMMIMMMIINFSDSDESSDIVAEQAGLFHRNYLTKAVESHAELIPLLRKMPGIHFTVLVGVLLFSDLHIVDPQAKLSVS